MVYGLQKGSVKTEAFIKTADKNVVDRYRAFKDEIHLDTLQRKIDNFQTRIDAAPKLITEIPPGLSTAIMQAIEEYNAVVPDLASLERQKQKLEELKTKAEAAELIPVGP